MPGRIGNNVQFLIDTLDDTSNDPANESWSCFYNQTGGDEARDVETVDTGNKKEGAGTIGVERKVTWSFTCQDPDVADAALDHLKTVFGRANDDTSRVHVAIQNGNGTGLDVVAWGTIASMSRSFSYKGLVEWNVSIDITGIPAERVTPLVVV